MKIEIEKIEKVIKDNDEKFLKLKEIHGQPNDINPTTDRYANLCRLFSCFIGDLYMLFGDEFLEEQGREYLQKLAEKTDKEVMS